MLWGSYVRSQQALLARLDLLETGLLSALLVALPPVLAGSVYFVFWHSLQHMLRMNHLMGRANARGWAGLGRELAFFLRRSAPLLAVSVAALTALYSWQWTAGAPVLISLALLVASVVTLPHALLVTLGMDAARWHWQAGGTAFTAALAAPPQTLGSSSSVRARASSGPLVARPQ